MPRPVIRNATVPTIAAGKVKVELVPLTLFWGSPNQVSQGTLRAPPPTPRRPDLKPIRLPTPREAGIPGIGRSCGVALKLKIMINATRKRTTAKTVTRTAVFSTDASRAPATTPTTIPGRTRKVIFQTTLPSRACEETDPTEVAIMINNEVPAATCIWSDWWIPMKPNR